MEAIMATRFGGPEVLTPVTLPTPEPAEGHLRVDVAYAGVGWLDTLIRRGDAPPGFAVTPPYVPGGAVAGTVTALGPGVTADWLGARVVTRAVAGGYADTAIADTGFAFRVPDGLGLPEALAVLDDGSTALALLEKTPVTAGDDVLVLPGLGGLGSLLVQLPRDAVVIAAVRGPEKVKLAHDLGVRAVDYGSPDWASEVPGVDVVFDGVGGALGAAALSLLRDGGRFSGYGMSSGTPTTVPSADHRRLASVADMSQLPEFWPETPRRVRQALSEAAAGRLIPLIGRTYPLTEAAAAHTDFEKRRAVGKILLHP
ncbi:zinc-binding dehydrogenase [Amycolatopsis sp. WQ 127309]|uniref:zinc-binding dehydrogenase n=1 Tax=Amycolatopsis sp. WQ 127309 TaxID=2932773 RepID=UPI001FF67B7A|nr:zinc-binding dehydrogenase [Amycolatopsis sp. WQ 127309]UOZ05027.1 zinc-binding dehydrogenase [Amycolatopsis sp. WQ 127309]